ncbi:MAG: PEP-CTERM sorting domain-containing protein [Verrucomicrobia bacterium]|nr:PEP-CTERM sorting domain-containing protein [Verrucomicrobiota bacterium]
MKTILATIVLGCAVFAAHGQGLVSINTVGVNSYMRFSNILTREWVSGDSVVAGLYWASDPATLERGGGTLVRNGGMNGTGLAVFRTGSAAGFISTVSFGGNRQILERAGQTTFFQLRAWSAGYDSYEEVMMSGQSGLGVSLVSGSLATPIVAAVPTSDTLTFVPAIPWAPGSSSSNPYVALVYFGPEPGPVALLGLGLLGFILSHRFRRRGGGRP